MTFQSVVEKQYELQAKAFTKGGWLFNPKVDVLSAIRDEAQELALSAGWQPWWKKDTATIDWDNCQMEIIDIYHFHLVGLLQDAAANIVEDEDDRTHDFVLDDAGKAKAIAMVTDWLVHAAETSARLGPVEEPYKAINEYLGITLYLGVSAGTAELFTLASSYGMSPEMLNTLYLAKNALNHFRSANNYKGNMDGPAYVKHWADGKEDNHFVMLHVRSLIEKGQTVSSAELYDTIARQYEFYTGNTARPQQQ